MESCDWDSVGPSRPRCVSEADVEPDEFLIDARGIIMDPGCRKGDAVSVKSSVLELLLFSVPILSECSGGNQLDISQKVGCNLLEGIDGSLRKRRS